MKKIISVVLALVMMMAICVPAFAATLNATTQSGNSTVLVDGVSDKGDGTYSVEIPAEVEFIWGNPSSEQNDYKITSQVKTDKRVQVTVVKAKDLTNENDATETIAFSVANAVGVASEAVVVAEAHAINLTIDNTDDWKTASIASYEGLITFEAEIVNA